MKKTIGYGFKLSSETMEKTLAIYTNGGGLLKTKKEAVEEIANAKKESLIAKNAKPKIFKVQMEIID